MTPSLQNCIRARKAACGRVSFSSHTRTIAQTARDPQSPAERSGAGHLGSRAAQWFGQWRWDHPEQSPQHQSFATAGALRGETTTRRSTITESRVHDRSSVRRAAAHPRAQAHPGTPVMEFWRPSDMHLQCSGPMGRHHSSSVNHYRHEQQHIT
jgi:hypothetical protein